MYMHWLNRYFENILCKYYYYNYIYLFLFYHFIDVHSYFMDMGYLKLIVLLVLVIGIIRVIIMFNIVTGNFVYILSYLWASLMVLAHKVHYERQISYTCCLNFSIH